MPSLEEILGPLTPVRTEEELWDRKRSFLKRGSRILGLHLSGSGPLDDLSPLVGLHDLQILIARDLGVRDASALSALTELRMVDLATNQISDISFCLSLPRLSYLNVRRNPIRELPQQLLDVHPSLGIHWVDQKGRVGLVLEGITGLVEPPISVVRQGTEAVRAHLAERRPPELQPLARAQVVVLGGDATTRPRPLPLGSALVPAPAGVASTLLEIAPPSASPPPDGAAPWLSVRVWSVDAAAPVEACLQALGTDGQPAVVLLHPADALPGDVTRDLRLISAAFGRARVLLVVTGADVTPSAIDGGHLRRQWPDLALSLMEVGAVGEGGAADAWLAAEVARLARLAPTATARVPPAWRGVPSALASLRTPVATRQRLAAVLAPDWVDLDPGEVGDLVDIFQRAGLVLRRRSPTVDEDLFVTDPAWLVRWVADQATRGLPWALSERALADALRASARERWPDLDLDLASVRYLHDLLVDAGIVLVAGDGVVIPHLLPAARPALAPHARDEGGATTWALAVGPGRTVRHIAHATGAVWAAMVPEDGWWHGGVVLVDGGALVALDADEGGGTLTVTAGPGGEELARFVAQEILSRFPEVAAPGPGGPAPDIVAPPVPGRTRTPFVFVSYSHDDVAEVRAFVAALEAFGVEVRWDRGRRARDDGAADHWQDAIPSMIDECTLFLLMASTSSEASETVARELKYATQPGQHVDIRAVPLGPDPSKVRFQAVDHDPILGWDEAVPATAAVQKVVEVFLAKLL